MESADLQRFDESRTHRGGDDKKSIGLSMVQREFGKELIVGHARRCGQVEFRADLRPDQLGNLGRRGDAIKIIGYIEIGLIERQRLNDWRVLGENRTNPQRDFFVDVESWFDENKVWA